MALEDCVSQVRVSLVPIVTGQSMEDRINARIAELEARHSAFEVVDVRLQLTDADRTSESFGNFPASSLALILYRFSD